MRFLVDECTGPAVSQWLRELGHDVADVYEEARGLSDEEIIRWAFDEQRILITNDRDFGEKVFRGQAPHAGIVYLRLDNERAPNKIAVLCRLLQLYSERLPGSFVVATERRVRFAGPSV